MSTKMSIYLNINQNINLHVYISSNNLIFVYLYIDSYISISLDINISYNLTAHIYNFSSIKIILFNKMQNTPSLSAVSNSNDQNCLEPWIVLKCFGIKAQQVCKTSNKTIQRYKLVIPLVFVNR